MDLSAGFRRDPAADPATVGEDAALAARIRAEIRSDGPITFARFMELALYDPDGGYYRSAGTGPGRTADFLTAPTLHPVFGHAVARQLVEIWERLGRPEEFVVHEHGAGSGALAGAIVDGLRRDAAALLDALRYVPIEVDEGRAGNPSVDEPITGVILANELVDALPVHRVGMRDGRLVERYVGLADDEAFTDAWAAPSTPALEQRLDREGITLRDGQSAEICLALDAWVAEATRPLERGLLLVIDYGAPASELYDATRRPDGTLRAFALHHLLGDVYAHVGRQDLTAHVDLTAVDAAARAAGLVPVASTTQAEFLMGNGVEAELRAIQADPATTLEAYVELRSALVRLIDPAGMGGFRVLAYGRRWPARASLAGFAYRLPGR